MLYAAKGSLHEQERVRLFAKAKQKPFRAVVLASLPPAHALKRLVSRVSWNKHIGVNLQTFQFPFHIDMVLSFFRL